MAQYRAKPTAISNLAAADSIRRSARTPLPQCKQARRRYGVPFDRSRSHCSGRRAGHGLRRHAGRPVTRTSCGPVQSSSKRMTPATRNTLLHHDTRSRHRSQTRGTRNDQQARAAPELRWRTFRPLRAPFTSGGSSESLCDPHRPAESRRLSTTKAFSPSAPRMEQVGCCPTSSTPLGPRPARFDLYTAPGDCGPPFCSLDGSLGTALFIIAPSAANSAARPRLSYARVWAPASGATSCRHQPTTGRGASASTREGHHWN